MQFDKELILILQLFFHVSGLLDEINSTLSITIKELFTLKETVYQHPLDPLSSEEIQKTSQIIRNHFIEAPQLFFCTINLKEPKKAEILSYFLADATPPESLSLKRKSIVNVINPVTEHAYEIVVDLLRNKIERLLKLPKGVQPPFAFDEITEEMEQIVFEDERIHLRLNKLGIYNTTNVLMAFGDFGYAGDRPNYVGRRMRQVFFFYRSSPEDNYFAHPTGFTANFDVLKKIVTEIEELPIHDDFNVLNRQGDGVPLVSHNFDPTLLPSDFFKKGVNPIEFTQDNGPSYKITGRLVEWQNFKLRIGFNEREGLILHNINYNENGTIRPLIYRASVSELFVPYGDPRRPFHRQTPYDSGQSGLGNGASEQHIQADCKGLVKFFDVVTSNRLGLPKITKNAICIYEEDVGVLMRKYSYRTGRSYSVRNQRLVISFAASIGNYEYNFLWIFQQDASIRMEVRVIGIVSPTFIAPGSSSGGHGTILAQSVVGQNHQHFLAYRLDTEIDGNENTISVKDVVSDGPTGSLQNPYGNGFKVKETILKTPSEARTKIQAETSRSWMIYGNTNKKNPVSGTPMGYKLVPEMSSSLMINKDSPLHPKCAFTDYNVWVTPFNDEQMFVGGRYLNNSGVPEWVENDGNACIENVDTVLWYVFGMSHIPRTEEFPIMPTETLGFWLKPYNFFRENPALNAPPFHYIPSQ